MNYSKLFKSCRFLILTKLFKNSHSVDVLGGHSVKAQRETLFRGSKQKH